MTIDRGTYDMAVMHSAAVLEGRDGPVCVRCGRVLHQSDAIVHDWVPSYAYEKVMVNYIGHRVRCGTKEATIVEVMSS